MLSFKLLHLVQSIIFQTLRTLEYDSKVMVMNKFDHE